MHTQQKVYINQVMLTAC